MRLTPASLPTRARIAAVLAVTALVAGIMPLTSAIPAGAATTPLPEATAEVPIAPESPAPDATPTPTPTESAAPDGTPTPSETPDPSSTPDPTPSETSTPTPNETPAPVPGDDPLPGEDPYPTEDPEAPADPTELSPGVPEGFDVPIPTDPNDPLIGEYAVRLSVEAQADLARFKPGMIIADSVFFTKGTMTEAQIQSFLNSKVASCRAGYTCLKDFRQSTTNKPADQMCSGYTGGTNESAARIIFKVSQSCGINPQVLLVMLQKEQGLVMHTWPSDWRYGSAMGQGCPDDAGCDPGFAGFFNQMYGGAWQMKRYGNPAGTSNYFNWYPVGYTSAVRYHPNSGCGTSPVLISNKATAALYYYTPYQPNAAAIKAGYGEGDACSAYGNRNFYNYFNDWFGPTTGAGTFVTAPAPHVGGYVVVGQKLTATAGTTYSPKPSAITYQWYRGGAPISGATGRTYTLTQDDLDRTVQIRVTASRDGYTPVTTSSTQYPVVPIQAGRVSGASREGTAVAASQAAYPNGAKVAFLATSSQFPDALSGAAAAARIGASLLLTPSDTLPTEVADELRRLGVTDVRLAGGPAVLSTDLVAQVRAAVPGANVSRISGADRYATSRAVVERTGSNKTVLIATGREFADALSASAIAGARTAPVLLVDGSAPLADPATLETLRKVGATSVILVGGEGVITAGVAASFKASGLSVSRISGADRYLTNAAVVRSVFLGAAPRTVVATGQDFPDALGAAVLAARLKQPLLLTRSACVAAPAMDFMRSAGTYSITMVGGTGVLTPDGVGRFRGC